MKQEPKCSTMKTKINEIVNRMKEKNLKYIHRSFLGNTCYKITKISNYSDVKIQAFYLPPERRKVCKPER